MFAADLARFAGAVVSLIGLGVVMGVSPTLVAVVLDVLQRASRPKRMISFLLLGLLIGATIILLLLQFVNPRVLESLIESEAKRILVQRGIDLTVGALFLLTAVVVGLRARKPRRPRKPRDRPMDKPWAMTVLGASNTVIGISGFTSMYLASRVIGGASDDDVLRVVLYLVFAFAIVSPYLALTRAWGRFPRLAERIQAFFTRIAAMDPRPWTAAFTLLAGLIFLSLGIWGAAR